MSSCFACGQSRVIAQLPTLQGQACFGNSSDYQNLGFSYLLPSDEVLGAIVV